MGKGHPERRKKREEWTPPPPSEWGNFFADGLATGAWERLDAMGSSSQSAPQLPNAASLALRLPEGLRVTRDGEVDICRLWVDLFLELAQ